MNDALAAAWRTAQARVAVTDEWRSFPSEALDWQYYRPLIALAQRAAAPQVEGEAALFLEEAYRFIDRFLPPEERQERAHTLLTE